MKVSHGPGRATAFALGLIACVAFIPSGSAQAGQDTPLVACAVASSSGPELRFVRTPRKCLVQQRGCSAGPCYAALLRMKWNWGNRAAKGHGKRGISTAGLFPVDVRLTKPVTKCGHTVFSKIKYSGKVAGESYENEFKLWTCGGSYP